MRRLPLSLALVLAASAAKAQDGGPGADLWPIYLALAALIVLMAVLLGYIWSLRNRTTDAAHAPGLDDGKRAVLLTSINDLPLGLPRGSVRAMLALLIVFGAMVFLAVSMATSVYKFPEALSGILGAILGFYFGKSSGPEDAQAVTAVAAANADARDAAAKAAEAATAAKTAQDEAAQSQNSLSTVQARHDELATDKLSQVQNKLREAVEIGHTLSTMLPGSFGKQVGAASQALSGTLATVEDLRSGNLAGALEKAGGLMQQAAPNLPVVHVLAKAAQLIGPALGSSIPPVALLTTLVGVGSKLGAAAYARWVARIMDQPYTPEQFSPTVFDSNAAATLVAEVPEFMTAFGDKLASGDRQLALDVVRLALSEDGGAGLVARFPVELAKLDQPSLDRAIGALQKAALDMLVANDLPREAGAAFGGPDRLLEAVDKLRADASASAGLDAVMTTVTALRQADKNPAAEFEAAAEKLASPQVVS